MPWALGLFYQSTSFISPIAKPIDVSGRRGLNICLLGTSNSMVTPSLVYTEVILERVQHRITNFTGP